jgi:16S rRNA (guanine(966)-N(2))-methyltransferase RsmD
MNLLAADLPGCRWLDLCCGSGAMACEALQRGAASVVAIDQDRRIAATARTNLDAVRRGLARAAQVAVHTAEVQGWLQRAAPMEFDLIYADPPYASGLYAAIADGVRRGGLLRPGGTLIWECSTSQVPDPPAGWRLRSERRYGSTALVLLELDPGAGADLGSTAENAAAAVLVPGCHEQPEQSHGYQAEHDAAEQGFDHDGIALMGRPQFFHELEPTASRAVRL